MSRTDDSQDVDYERVELVWPGKNRPMERVSLPFQTIERVNDVRRSSDAQAELAAARSRFSRARENALVLGGNRVGVIQVRAKRRATT